MNKQLYLDHWPPLLEDLADGFALIERLDQRVSLIELEPRDADLYCASARAADFIDDNRMWGAELRPRARVQPESLQLHGEGGASVRFNGPTVPLPAGVAYHKQPPPYVPTDEEEAVLNRYRTHATPDDFVTNARGYAPLRRLARDTLEVESSVELLKQGIMGYKLLEGGLRARIVVRRDGPGPSAPQSSSPSAPQSSSPSPGPAYSEPSSSGSLASEPSSE